MQCGRAFPCILQEIWRRTQTRSMYGCQSWILLDTYHCGTLCMSHVGVFACFIPSSANDVCIIVCIYLVLPMGWVDTPNCFCTFSETLTDVANTFLHTLLPLPGHGAIVKITKTCPVLPHTLDSLIHIYCYMDDMIIAVQGGPERQGQFFNVAVWALKWIFPSSPR